MVKFTINELSTVDFPAQEGAQALILKRRDPQSRETRKCSLAQFATDSVKGHQHGIEISCYDNRVHMWVMHAVAEDADTGHDHQLIMGEDGTYVLSENAGHTHDIDTASLNAVIAALLSKAKEGSMDPKELEALKKSNERLKKIVLLSAVAKAHFDGLETEEAQDAFLSKSADDQAAAIQKAADDKAAAEAAKNAADPVVYTSKVTGIEVRKSDGPTVLALVKKQDEDAGKIDTRSSRRMPSCGRRPRTRRS